MVSRWKGSWARLSEWSDSEPSDADDRGSSCLRTSDIVSRMSRIDLTRFSCMTDRHRARSSRNADGVYNR